MLQYFTEPVVIIWILAFLTTVVLFFIQYRVHANEWKPEPLGLILFAIPAIVCALLMMIAPLVFFDEVLLGNPAVRFVFNWFWIIPTLLAYYFVARARATPAP